MRSFTGKTYWLVGASEGLGAALAHKLGAAGATVVLSARSEDKLTALVDELPGEARAVAMDVADMDNVREAAKTVGQVDGVVFLAGVYWPMKATEWDVEAANAMADINFTGMMRVMGVCVPDMVARDSGHIVITGSLSGFRGLPGAIGYAASKAGTMALAESMYADLKDTGVDVQLANPGFIKTRLTDKNDFKMPFLMQPDEAAEEMMDLMRSTRFKKSFPRVFSWVFRLSQFMPDWMYTVYLLKIKDNSLRPLSDGPVRTEEFCNGKPVNTSGRSSHPDEPRTGPRRGRVAGIHRPHDRRRTGRAGGGHVDRPRQF